MREYLTVDDERKPPTPPVDPFADDEEDNGPVLSEREREAKDRRDAELEIYEEVSRPFREALANIAKRDFESFEVRRLMEELHRNRKPFTPENVKHSALMLFGLDAIETTPEEAAEYRRTFEEANMTADEMWKRARRRELGLEV